jgi:hypothetical protein
MSDFENGRYYPKSNLDDARGRRQGFQEQVENALGRIEKGQASYHSRLETIEAKLNSHLEIVAENTSNMSKSLELIQASNTKLIDVISNKNSVPTGVVIFIIVMITGVFLTRELANSGGRAKLSISGVDIEGGKGYQEAK